VAVLHRIEVDVIEVAGKIVLIAQGVFPIPPLPNPALAFGDRGWRRSVRLVADHAKNRF
jgi:hypothetical protein